ncbi:MAG: T9SS type A sorting domain-containing protein [Chitinophagales bacterium]|nr:T9SS type A sorting domain-containing protein [Chitinophagales bacterium]
MNKVLQFLFLFIIIPKMYGQTLGDYKTFASGDWANVSNWSRYNGTTWVNPAPSAPTSTDGIITVDHIMTVASSITIDQTIISVGGSVELLTGGAITVANGASAIDLEVFGIYKRTATATTLTPTGNVTFQSGSYYIHNAAGGTIPTCTWHANSILQIDASIANNEFTESFGNVVFNGSSGCVMGTSTSANFVNTIQGNLIIATTGTVSVSNQTGFGATLTINGGLTLNTSGSNFIIDAANSSTNVTKKVIVKGNYTQTNGTFNFTNNTSTTISTGTRNAQMDVEGNFEHTNGIITETASDVDFYSRINMTKTTGTQLIESIGFSNATTNVIDFYVANANAKTVVDVGKTFTQNAATTFVISAGTSIPDLDINGTFINKGTTAWTTSGTWGVNNGGTYIHNTSAGISTPLNSATLNIGSNFIYRGSSTLNTPFSLSGRTYFNLAFESTSGLWAPSHGAGASPLVVNGLLRVGDGSANGVNLSQGSFSGTITFNGDIDLKLNGTLTCNSFSLASDKILTMANTSNFSLAALSTAQTFTLNGTVKEANTNGFSGGATRAISNTNAPTITLGSVSTIEFNGSSNQSTAGLPATVANVNINNSSGVTLFSNIEITTSLILSSGLLTIGVNNLTLGNTAVVSGSPSASKMVVATSSGEFRKNYTGTGAFIFPVGDNTGTPEYSPVVLNFIAGTFSSAYASVRLSNTKHSSNLSTTDFLNRYWVVNTSGITSPSCIATFTYVDGDITGTETNLYGGRYLSSTWNCLDLISDATNTISNGVTEFGDFTAGDITSMNCCMNPTNGGTISGVQSVCGSYDPTNIISSSLPSGHMGVLEYKWQYSITGPTSGFSDIASSNTPNFDPSTITQTTWYKRLARVTCKNNWIGAVESNVIAKTVLTVPNAATVPTPANSAMNVSINADLSWVDGGGAATYDVYFGTSSPGAFQGNQTTATFDPGTMTNSTVYYWRIDAVNSCGTTTGAIWSFTTESVACIPPVIDAKYDALDAKTICSGQTFTLTANPVGGNNCATWEYAWYWGTGSDNSYWDGTDWDNAENWGSFAIINNVGSTNTTSYKVKVRCSSDSTCNNIDVTGVVVTVDQIPSSSNAGSDIQQCNNSAFYLSGNSPTIGAGIWTVYSGSASIGTPTSPNSSVTGITAGSSSVLRWTISNGVCTPSYDDVTLINDALPTTAYAGGDINNCNNSTFTLSGNTPSIGTGLWTIISGSAIITTPTSPTSGVTGVAAGTSATLRWTITNGGCTPSFDDVVLTNYAIPSNSPAASHTNVAQTTTNVRFIWTTPGDADGVNIYRASDGILLQLGNTVGYYDYTTTANTQVGIKLKAYKGTTSCENASFGASASAYSSQNVPISIGFSGTTQTQTTVVANGSFPNPTSGLSGLFYTNSTESINSGWITTTSWINTGLICGSSYNYLIKARNGDGDETIEIGPTTNNTSACVSSNTDYFRTINTGAWTTAANWESSHDNVFWFPATLAPIDYVNNKTVTVRSGNIVSISANLTVDEVVVASGGEILYSNGILTINNGTGTDMDVLGVLNRTSPNPITVSGTLNFGNGGKYISNYATASIPTATWNANSTLQIDASIADNEFTESFGNVLINGTSSFNLVTGATNPVIQGNFTMATMGTVGLSTSAGSASTCTINGNFIMNANGSFIIDRAVSSTNVTKTVTINGNFTLSNGSFYLSNNSSTLITLNTRTSILNVYGNFSHNGGTFGENAVDDDFISRVYLKGNTNTTFESNAQTGRTEVFLNKTAAALVTLSDNSEISHNLNMSGGLLVLDMYNLSLPIAATLTAGSLYSATNMIVPTGTGELRKFLLSTGSITYPVGDNIGTVEYSPVTLNFTAGAYSGGAYVSIRLKNEEEPEMVTYGAVDYINRYWIVSQVNIGNFVCIPTFTYLQADVIGTESNFYGLKNSTGNWSSMDVANTVANTFTKSTGITSFSTFTAGLRCVPPELNAKYNNEEFKAICLGDAYTLTANPTGHVGCSSWEYAWYSGTGNDNTYWNGTSWTNAETWGAYATITNVNPTVNTIYKVKARCVARTGCASIDNLGVEVEVNSTPPLLADLYSPSNNAINMPLVGDLIWGKSNIASAYDIYFGTTNPPALLEANRTINSIGYNVTQYNTTYYWRVDTKNGCYTTTGNVWSFTTTDNLTFTIANTTSCGTDFGDGTTTSPTGLSLQPANIVTSGLPTSGLTSNGIALRQVNVKIGNNSTCQQLLGTYVLKLRNPQGVTITLASPLTGNNASTAWVDVKYRDEISLERIKDYPDGGEQLYYPFSIGYYAIETDGQFANFNTTADPNGTWSLHVIENATSGTEASLERVDLIFGYPFEINDVSGNNLNNACSEATCIDGVFKVRATNDGYTQNDPYYPGHSVDGCLWNQANNNSAWFYFIASAPNPKIVVSGSLNTSLPGLSDMQAVVMVAPTSCTIPTDVVNGGCPDDESVNNLAYKVAYGGGISVPGNVYSNGISFNSEFNLSGLTVGQKYYLYVDGNGGNPSTFYIESPKGCVPCNATLLPIQLLSFEAKPIDNQWIKLSWITASEINNKGFEIQRSIDGISFERLGWVDGAMFSHSNIDYTFSDRNVVSGIKYYYRLKQVDIDGKISYSKINIASITNNAIGIIVFPNPANNLLYVQSRENIVYYEIFDAIGKTLIKQNIDGDKLISIDVLQYPEGVYFLKTTLENGENFIKKWVKQL